MKITDAVAKLHRYMEDYTELYSEVADLIAIVPDIPKKRIKIYIAGQLYNVLYGHRLDDGYMLIDAASEIMRAAVLVKYIKLAGK